MKSLAILLLFSVLAKSLGAGTFTDLGVQITCSTIQGTTFAREPDGREVVCTVMRGDPAKLIVMDLQSGELLHRLPLEGADGAWNACTASDGSVYIGTDANAHVYRYIPGEDSAHDLGKVLPEQTFVWDVCAGADGEVFCGTYPGCRVVRYHPKDGFSDVGKGPVAPGENYARDVAFDRASGKIYAGIGSHAHLIELDPKTGEKSGLLPSEYAQNEFVYAVDVLDGRVYAYVSRLGKSLVIDPKTRKVEAILPAMSGQQTIVVSPEDHRVYYTVNGQLMCFDPSRPSESPKSVMKCTDAIGLTWSGGELVMFSRYAGVTRYDPRSGKSSSKSFKLPSEPTKIQSIELGPDGRIWTGGYLSGGNAAFHPKTGKSEQYRGLSQAEDMTVVGQCIYFGEYPGARLAVYDTSKPWDVKNKNPRQFGNLGPENQSRPMAMCGVKELNKVFIGTVPEYGMLGGVLAEYDIASEKLTVHHDVIPKQSIVSLCYANGLIVGGTSIFGGLGQEPAEKDAKIFIWNQTKHEKIFESIPAPGCGAITGLFVGPDRNVWAMAGGTLFIFDAAAQKIVSQKHLFEIDYTGKHVWRDASFAVHPSGQIYGTAGGKFFRLDPISKDVTILREKDVRLLAMDRDGRLYFGDKAHLWQYTP